MLLSTNRFPSALQLLIIAFVERFFLQLLLNVKHSVDRGLGHHSVPSFLFLVELS